MFAKNESFVHQSHYPGGQAKEKKTNKLDTTKGEWPEQTERDHGRPEKGKLEPFVIFVAATHRRFLPPPVGGSGARK